MVDRTARGDGPMTGAVVLGVGGSLPGRVVTNDDLATRLDTSDEWIRSRTGIGARRWVEPGTATSDLAVDAGARALRSAGVSTVDAVIVATTTPDRLCPAVAPEVAARLGLVGTPAHDVAAVCTGFLYGLANGVGLIASGAARTVLLIAAETFSTILDPQDRGTAVIFGDGAGAVVLGAAGPGAPGAVGPCVLGSDGIGADLIQIPAGGSRQRSSGLAAAPGEHYFKMRGKEVFRQAVERMAEVSLDALARAGLTVGDIDHLAPHQANMRICAAVAHRLGVPEDRVLANLDEVGNTAAASIPVLLAQAAADGRVKAGDQVLAVAFGGGLTWGAVTLAWPDAVASFGTFVPAGS
ncbi:3-oxoacyl-[acyl-carrier-protein] synthase III [Saccharothrix saharensis]|uniref:Beta-ketoacyl-[acyl-carrier-protein] synthase III n=1 Tax=Saccharothrix saharensis TaxID=571190 RepID=A0A543J6E8_9PSEU|nr:beta-ketoacyl-ACP synthase III [Saccharothrix saharensis]TQM78410.1 3-oxoacyl-[acyl-carrier-protein] synthase III [Saccharothrix saharensis]